MRRGVISIQMLSWVLRAVFLVSVLVVLLFFIDAHINAKITIFNAEASTLVTRVLYHPQIMLHDVALQRVIPGVVDVTGCKTLLDDAFDQSIYYGSARKHIAGKFIVTDGKNEICGASFNKKHFDFLDVQRQVGGLFGAGIDVHEVKIPVILFQDGKRTNGFMAITILKEA